MTTRQNTEKNLPDQQQVEWSRALQSRLIDVGKDQVHDVQDLMAEAACLLAALTGNPICRP